jgi:hypothetical protein
MSDRLEDFIRNNRAELDLDEPSAHLWAGIENRIPSSRRMTLYRTISVAASVMVLVVAAYFMGVRSNANSFDEDLFASEAQFKEFQEASDYYTTTIDYKTSQAKQAGMDQDVINDLKQLDEVYKELKNELLTTEYQDKEYLINLMINNYKTKINILETIINKNEKNEYKTTTNETLNI